MKQEKVRCRSSEGDCDVTSEGRKCVACRYRQCLRIGMDPLLVQVRDQLTLLSWSPAPVSRGQETDNERRRLMMEITRTERSHNPRLNTAILLRAALTSVR